MGLTTLIGTTHLPINLKSRDAGNWRVLLYSGSMDPTISLIISMSSQKAIASGSKLLFRKFTLATALVTI